MRNAFFSELCAWYGEDSRAVFLTGDLGYKLIDPLVEVDASRTMNLGLREGAMVGFAAGLAKAGMVPVAYSITPFITLRCLEQIKLDLCYNRTRAILVGVGGGYAYGPNGPTHHGIDDIAALSCCPGLRIWTPCDAVEVRACVRQFANLDGPAYLRLGRTGEPLVHDAEAALPSVDEPRMVRDGEDGVVVSCGVILHEVLKAVETLDHNPRVVHVPTLRPFPGEALLSMLPKDSAVLSVEEHVSPGGLGQELAEWISRARPDLRLESLSAPVRFPESCMSREATLAWAGIDSAGITQALNRQRG